MGTEFEDFKAYTTEVESSYGPRNTLNQKYEDLYWMKWHEAGQLSKGSKTGDVLKITKSPRPANAVEGMVRLLCASDPQFSVPRDLNSAVSLARAEAIEKFAKAMISASGKVKGSPLHYDVIRSAILFDEIHLLVQSTKELVNASQGGPGEARAKEIHARTPFIFKATHPSKGYPVWDELGLSFFYSKRMVKQSDIISQFGERGKEAIERMRKTGLNQFKEVELKDAYDLQDRWVVIGGDTEFMYKEPHGLSYIPIVATTVEGSDLFDKVEDQRHGVLYNLLQSGIVERQNMFLTVIYSMMYAIGSNPMFVEYLHNPNNAPHVDYSVPGFTARYHVGERREPMMKQVIDPSLMQGWDIAQNLEMESTIYRQTLGEPLGANAPYSMVALLSQSGRLPLLMPQRLGGFAIGRAVEMALKMMRKEKTTGKVAAQGIYLTLEPKNIPEQFEIEAKLDIAMPQDLLNNVNAAIQGTQGDKPLFTVEWAQENLLQIGQPKEMRKAIWDEIAEELRFRKYVLEQEAEIARLQQQAEVPGAAGGIPGMPQGDPATLPQGMGTPPIAPEEEPFPPEEPMEPMMPMAPPPDQPIPGGD